MIGLRVALAILLIGVGIAIFVRVVSLGLNPDIITGAILGVAVTALGAHKLSLALRAWKTSR